MGIEEEKKVRYVPISIYVSDGGDPEKVKRVMKAFAEFVKTFGLEITEEPPKDAIIEE